MKKLFGVFKCALLLAALSLFLLPAPGFGALGQELGDGFYLLDSSVDPESSVVVVKLTPGEMTKALTDVTRGEKLQEITRLLYTKFADDWDFLFFTNFTSQVNEGNQHWRRLYDTVDGLGYPKDEKGYGAISYGSPSKLKGYAFLSSAWSFVDGTTLHEIAHQYAAYIVSTHGFVGTTVLAHWGVSNAGGRLGGFKYSRIVEENVGGALGKTKYQVSLWPEREPNGITFAHPGFYHSHNNVPYSDIELYLMGLISPQELRNKSFNLDIYTDAEQTFDQMVEGMFTATTKISYSIDDLIARAGPRTPDASASQKHFKALTLMLVDDSVPVDYATMTDILKWFSGPITDTTY